MQGLSPNNECFILTVFIGAKDTLISLGFHYSWSQRKALHPLSEDDIALFREAAQGAAPIEQDKRPPEPPKVYELKRRNTQRQGNSPQDIAAASREASQYFPDGFEAHFSEGAMQFTADGESTYLTKQLRRGDYTPELLLDLHGMTLVTARQELAALLIAREKERIDCCCIMHGHGSGKLKQQVPHWLVTPASQSLSSGSS